jgi:hypothetical protein
MRSDDRQIDFATTTALHNQIDFAETSCRFWRRRRAWGGSGRRRTRSVRSSKRRRSRNRSARNGQIVRVLRRSAWEGCGGAHRSRQVYISCGLPAIVIAKGIERAEPWRRRGRRGARRRWRCRSGRSRCGPRRGRNAARLRHQHAGAALRAPHLEARRRDAPLVNLVRCLTPVTLDFDHARPASSPRPSKGGRKNGITVRSCRSTKCHGFQTRATFGWMGSQHLLPRATARVVVIRTGPRSGRAHERSVRGAPKVW